MPVQMMRFPEIQGFKFHTENCFTYLGTQVASRTQREFNFKSPYAETYQALKPYIRAKLQPRSGIQHSLLGRILNVKSFIGSKLLYIFSLTPSPPKPIYNQIQAMLNAYIWSNGRHHIAAKLLYQPWDVGGFAMYSCEYQDYSLKLKWINRLFTEQQGFWQTQMRSCFSIPMEQLKRYNGPTHGVFQLVKKGAFLPTFWTDVIRIWCDLTCSKDPANPQDTLLFSNLGIKSRHVQDYALMETLMNLEVYTVSDFLQFSRRCTPVQANILHVKGILAGIPRRWKTQTPPRQGTPIGWQLDLAKPVTVAQLHNGITRYYAKEPQKTWDFWSTALGVSNVQSRWAAVVQKRLHHTEIKMRTFYVKYIY